MITLHQLFWYKKDLGYYVNFDSDRKEIIDTFRYESIDNYSNNLLNFYRKELKIKIIPYDLAYTRRLKELANFWAYMPIYVDKDHAGQRTKFFNYLTAKNLFGYDTDTYTQEDLAMELSIKLWLAYYYHKHLSLLYLVQPSIFEHISPKVKDTPNYYHTLLRVRYSPKTNLVRLKLTEWGNDANKHAIVLPYDVFKSTGITGQYLFENIELLFRVIFNLPAKKGKSK